MNVEWIVSNDNSQEQAPAAADHLALMPGQRLQTARELRGLSVEQVARELRLSRRFVVAIEGDDYKELPEPAFVRGYMRRYAQLVLLSPDDIAARFDECYAADSATPEPDARPRNPVQLLGDVARPRLRPGRLAGWAALALMLALLAGFLLWNVHGSRPEPVAAVTVTVPAALPSAAPVTAPAAAVPVSTAPAAAAPVANVLPLPSGPAVLPPPVGAQRAAVAEDTLVLALTADSWVSVRDAGNHELAGALKKAGETLILKGQAPFAVSLGNAPAVTVTINGRSVDLRPHTRGVVATLTVDR
jgi:cytoskeleton protein RodZ